MDWNAITTAHLIGIAIGLSLACLIIGVVLRAAVKFICKFEISFGRALGYGIVVIVLNFAIGFGIGMAVGILGVALGMTEKDWSLFLIVANTLSLGVGFCLAGILWGVMIKSPEGRAIGIKQGFLVALVYAAIVLLLFLILRGPLWLMNGLSPR